MSKLTEEGVNMANCWNHIEADIKKVEAGNYVAGTRVRYQLAEIKRICQRMRIMVQLHRAEAKTARKHAI